MACKSHLQVNAALDVLVAAHCFSDLGNPIACFVLQQRQLSDGTLQQQCAP